MELPGVQIQTKTDSFLSKVGKVTRSQKVSASPDFRVTATSRGTHLELSRRHKYSQGGFNLATNGLYDYFAAYLVNDVIRVDADATFNDEHGSAIAVSPGLWVCVREVPSYHFKANLAATHVNPALLSHLVRQDGVKYYPVFPLPDLASRYWFQLVPLGACAP